jgi:hypothetical protein
MTTRRGFLAACLAMGAAPAIVKAGILMPSRTIFLPPPFEIQPIAYITGPELLNLRELARANLVKWYGEQMDIVVMNTIYPVRWSR